MCMRVCESQGCQKPVPRNIVDNWGSVGNIELGSCFKNQIFFLT